MLVCANFLIISVKSKRQKFVSVPSLCWAMSMKFVFYCTKFLISVTRSGLSKLLGLQWNIARTQVFLTFVNSFIFNRRLLTIQSLAFGLPLKDLAIALVPTIFSRNRTPIFAHMVKDRILKHLEIARRIHTRLLLLQLPMLVPCPAFIVISHTS